MKISNILITAVITLMVALIGCSSGKSPIIPSHEPVSIDTVPIVGLSGADNNNNAHGIMGMYELKINPGSSSAELVSIRTGTIGESYVVSGAAFFTITPCADCLKIESISLTPEGDIQLGMRIAHPFEPGNSEKPPSAVNRNDLDVFDVALVVIPNDQVAQSYGLTGVDVYTEVLKDADGYTRELANVLNNNTAMPYALAVDESQTLPAPTTWNKLGMGEESNFDVVFNIAEGENLFYYVYVTMGYGFSAVKSDRLNPRYLNPEFNRKSAWKINVKPPEGDNPPEFGNTWDVADSLTTHDVTVEVYDWQIDANVDQNLTNDTDIYASSNVSSVSVEIPGMNNTVQSVYSDDGTGTGLPDSPLVFVIAVANENLIGSGEYTGLVKVTDERPVGTIGDRDYLIDVPDGINIQNYELLEYATYQTFTATVISECGDISGDITSPACPVTGVSSGAYIQFSASATSGNGGGDIVLYEWDHDYDGNTFDSEFTGALASIGPFDNPDCPSPNPTPENYTVAVRATDSCVPPNVTIFATCLVTVDTCCGPITGSITSPTCPVTGVSDDAYIDFTASASSANGGSPIVLYEWDYDYDGITFTTDFTGESESLGPFDNPYCPTTTPPPVDYTVAVRATDSCVPPNVSIFDTCVVTVDECCLDQELSYDFASCGSDSDPYIECQGWVAGGCSLPNSSNSYGAFKWGCTNGTICSMTHPYLTTGGYGSFHGGGIGCNNPITHGSSADFNVVSPSITLPPSNDGYFEFDHCNGFASGATAYVYISLNDCSGPWTQIWSTTTPDGCFSNTQIDISDYSGNNVMFRIRYQSASFMVGGSDCGGSSSGLGNAGITIDDVKIAGCFNGTLEEN